MTAPGHEPWQTSAKPTVGHQPRLGSSAAQLVPMEGFVSDVFRRARCELKSTEVEEGSGPGGALIYLLGAHGTWA
jgi:hypothetical protein